MKKILLTLILLSLSLTAQDSMRTFASANYQVKAYLVPSTENEFIAKAGTRVRIIMTLVNDGKTRFILNRDKFLSAALMIKARELEFPIYLEKFSQVEFLKAQEKTLQNRIQKVTALNDEKALNYAKMLFPNEKFTAKAALLEKLNKDLKSLNGLDEKAQKFDQARIVEAGAKLSFAASGLLPEGNDKPEDYCDLSIRIINSDNKHISIPVTAIFY